MSATKVTLRKRELPSGKITLYLDFYPPVRNPRTQKLSRREYLGIYLVKNPRSAIDRNSNSEKMKIAEAIRAQREISVIKEQYGFADKTRLKVDFLAFFYEQTQKHTGSFWRTYQHFKDFTHGKCTVADLSVDFCNRFKQYLLTCKSKLKKDGTISQNTAADYWISFRSVVKSAYKEKLLLEDLTLHLEGIETVDVHKDFLTLEELQRLAAAPCGDDTIRRASLFSCLSGLRISDIRALTWQNIQPYPGGGTCIDIRTSKTGTEGLIPISDEAVQLLGPWKDGPIFGPIDGNRLRKVLPEWMAAAGITKHITFHCFRHTYATLLASSGIPIYTVSKLLAHNNVKTTQIYADLVDENKRRAADSITLTLTPKP